MLQKIIQKKLENYVKKYFLKHPNVKLVVVTGSVEKTSTKVAIGTVLAEKFKVRLHEGNHNTFLSAPLAILGVEYPDNIKSINAWREVFKACKQRIRDEADVDVIVQELGSDRIGQVKHFGKYLKPDYAVITAVSAEHMEFFKTIDMVAREELEVANYSKIALINRDDIDSEFAKYLTNPNINTYGTSVEAEYHFISEGYTAGNGHKGKLIAPEWLEPVDATINVFGEHTLRPAIAGVAIGVKFGITPEEVIKGLIKVSALPGRMNMLRGVKNSVLIDDTYNSSPLAVKSSLNELYKLPAPQKIAVLGSMNELGLTSAEEHRELGKMCDPSQLAWVVTVGDEAEKYLAPSAKSRGCQVKVCKTAIEAGAFVNSVIEPNATILFKGSQGNVYLEEAVKILLHNATDSEVLVRQSEKWLKIKNDFFSKFK